jgi:hypothetical protein
MVVLVRVCAKLGTWLAECAGCECFDTFLPMSAVMVSHRPPFDCSSSVSMS